MDQDQYPSLAKAEPLDTTIITLRLHHDELGHASYVGCDPQDAELLQRVFHTDRIHHWLLEHAHVYAKYQGYILVTAETTVEG
jgi:hypothetical protein